MSENEVSPEYLANVLAITREQLARAMSFAAELEAALAAERNNAAQLKEQLEAASKKPIKE